MKALIHSIVSYLQFLETNCSIAVSIHFSADNFYSLPDSAVLELKRFNTHKNPYCILVKRQYHNQCIQTQREIRLKCGSNTGFCHICHAGVKQYIHPLYHSGSIIGFAAVCGFRSKYYDNCVIDRTTWEHYLSPGQIPDSVYASALAPLDIMLGKLFTDYAVKKSDEYTQILHYLNEYHTNVTLDDLCQHLSRSRSHVSHLFKSRNGVSINEYCNTLKLEDARHLLEISTQSITEIGFDVGFHDTSYFIRLFRQRFGISPLKYRSEYCKRP